MERVGQSGRFQEGESLSRGGAESANSSLAHFPARLGRAESERAKHIAYRASEREREVIQDTIKTRGGEEGRDLIKTREGDVGSTSQQSNTIPHGLHQTLRVGRSGELQIGEG